MLNAHRNATRLLAVTLGLITSLSLVLSADAKPLKYTIGDPRGRDSVSFTSDAPVELINGHTNKISGDVEVDDSFKADKQHPFKVKIDVDLASIDTGISLRNQHMRENFLETGQYPKATFEATSLKFSNKPNLTKPDTVTITATGNFTVHGVTVRKTIPLQVSYYPASSELAKKRTASGNLIRIRGKFPVTLAQHKINRPEAVFVKLAETVFVTIDTMGTDGAF